MEIMQAHTNKHAAGLSWVGTDIRKWKPSGAYTVFGVFCRVIILP
jgi:hypothetical protein